MIIDDTELIDKYIAEINIHHLYQAHGYPFTIEPLKSLIGEDSFTTFTD